MSGDDTAAKIAALQDQDPLLDWPPCAAVEWSLREVQEFYDTAGAFQPAPRGGQQTTRRAAASSSSQQLPAPSEPEPEPCLEPTERTTPRVFACSDIHVDYRENWAWCQQLSSSAYLGDVLIIAGDVSDDSAKLRETFSLLKGKFAEVFFTIGNHDLWIRGGSWRVAPQQPLDRSPPAKPADSLVKLRQVRPQAPCVLLVSSA